MQTVVGVSFKKAGKIYYFDPSDIELRSGDNVIVETSRGVELGEVVINPRDVEEDQIVQPLKKVIRKATPKDLEQLEINQQKEKEAYVICLEKIGNHGLPMKLVDVEYTFDNNKIIFYFTADGRVDFRELVKDLASVFRTRIELRQIGVRDEAKMIGGLGPCGLELCCKTFLREFEPISIKMAKTQDLSLNPAKISGICGRLMCCLRYECDTYDDLPIEDEVVILPDTDVVSEDEYVKFIGFKNVPEIITEEEEEVGIDQRKGNKKTWDNVDDVNQALNEDFADDTAKSDEQSQQKPYRKPYHKNKPQGGNNYNNGNKNYKKPYNNNANGDTNNQNNQNNTGANENPSNGHRNNHYNQNNNRSYNKEHNNNGNNHNNQRYDRNRSENHKNDNKNEGKDQ